MRIHMHVYDRAHEYARAVADLEGGAKGHSFIPPLELILMRDCGSLRHELYS